MENWGDKNGRPAILVPHRGLNALIEGLLWTTDVQSALLCSQIDTVLLGLSSYVQSHWAIQRGSQSPVVTHTWVGNNIPQLTIAFVNKGYPMFGWEILFIGVNRTTLAPFVAPAKLVWGRGSEAMTGPVLSPLTSVSQAKSHCTSLGLFWRALSNLLIPSVCTATYPNVVFFLWYGLRRLNVEMLYGVILVEKCQHIYC